MFFFFSTLLSASWRSGSVRARPHPHVHISMSMRYVKNKAGLTGQTVPGRRIPGHWPYPGPEELAETEPCVPGLIDVPFFVSFNTPHERVLWPSSAGMAAPTLACRGFGLPALLLGLAAGGGNASGPNMCALSAAKKVVKDTDSMKLQGTETEMTEENSKEERGVKYGTRPGTGQLAVPGTRAPQLMAEPVGRTLRSGV